MAKFLNRFKVATATTGTGTATLGPALAGYRTAAAAGAVTGDVLRYWVEDGTDFEWGYGVYNSTGPTLTRSITNGGSSTGSLLNLSGSAVVYCDLAIEDVVTGRNPGGRLTLTSGVPVLTSDVTLAGTIYYTPYLGGDTFPVFDGTSFIDVTFTELSNVATDTTKNPTAVAAAKVYDLFGWLDGATPRISRGPAWTSDTVRAAGGGLTIVKGRPLNTTAITNGPAAQRGTHLGTVRSNDATANFDMRFGTGGTGTNQRGWMGVWNTYNRISMPFSVSDTTATWTYNTATFRSSNNSAGNRVSFVRGFDENSVRAIAIDRVAPTSSASASYGAISIGLDSTTAKAADASQAIFFPPASTTASSGQAAVYSGKPGIGFHYLQMIEFSNSPTATFFGAEYHQLSAEIWG